jgi:CheY-like chemotaxis protein
MNLCINARDAMQSKGTIRVSARQPRLGEAVCASCRGRIAGDFVEFAVADTGTGIAPEVMERMFEPFFSTKEAGRGSGMGLSIVHGIVHEYGGHILVDSSPAGARFRVLFPAIPAEQAAQEPQPGPDAAPRPRLNGRVLVVDDEDMVADFMRELLRGWGLEVTAVSGVEPAREVFAAAPQRFDLVLTDHTMPRMTGLELARGLRAVRPGLPVIVFSGCADVIPESQLAQAGVELLQKPIDEAALLAALRKHLKEGQTDLVS